MADARSYVAGRYAFDLGGGTAAFIKSCDGGNLKADVISDPMGTDNIIHKKIGQPKWEDISIQIGLSSCPALNDWIQQSWDKQYSRKSGAIIACDFDYHAKARRDFYEALITEVGFPAMDASSKESCYMSVKMKPEKVTPSKGDGSVVKGDATTAQQKMWLPSNFRFELGDLDATKVTKIDAITVKQGVATLEVGAMREAQIEPAKLEFPNLTLYLPESHAQGWVDWAEDFIMKGNNGQSAEKTGALTFLSPNLQDELGVIEFQGVGIFGIAPEKSEANNESVKKVKVELYCEVMRFKPSTSATKSIG